MLLHRQEHHADAVLAGWRQREAQAGALAREELMRDLDQQAGAVAGHRIAAAGAAVRQVDQDLDALEDDVVRLFPFDVGHKADAAGVALAGGVIQALRGRQPVGHCVLCHLGYSLSPFD